MSLSALEKDVYKRQMMMEDWGEPAQERLKASTVFVAGCGGLGSPASIYMAVAGVGHLRICDFDSPEWSNLNRQILHDASRIGVNKAVSGKKTLEKVNGLIRVTALAERITEESADRLVGEAQLILDCMDNFDTRFVLNACALRKNIPLIHGSIRGLDGRVAFMKPGHTACLRCLIQESPPKEVFPVLGATPGIIGTMQALEAVRYLAGGKSPLEGRLLIWDGAAMESQIVTLRRDPACPVCAQVPAAGAV